MASIMCPTSVKRLWLYRQTAEQEWQVGWFDSLDQWCIDSSHTRSADAADRVHWLNGAPSISIEPAAQLEQAEAEIVRLQGEVTALTHDRDKWRTQAGRRRRTSKARGRGQR